MNALKITLRKKKVWNCLIILPISLLKHSLECTYFMPSWLLFFFYFFFQLHYEMNGNIYDIRKAIIYHRKNGCNLNSGHKWKIVKSPDNRSIKQSNGRRPFTLPLGAWKLWWDTTVLTILCCKGFLYAQCKLFGSLLFVLYPVQVHASINQLVLIPTV